MNTLVTRVQTDVNMFWEYSIKCGALCVILDSWLIGAWLFTFRSFSSQTVSYSHVTLYLWYFILNAKCKELFLLPTHKQKSYAFLNLRTNYLPLDTNERSKFSAFLTELPETLFLFSSQVTWRPCQWSMQ